MANQPTINAIWAEGTSNKTIFQESDIKLGIAYKGAVVSNQLNGIGYALYQMLDFVQRSGGYYNNSKVYNINDIVSIVRQTDSTPMQVEYYRCKTQELFAVPPIRGAIIDDSYEVNIYTGGVLNSINWERLSGDGDGTISITRLDEDNPFLEEKRIQFLTPLTFNTLEYNQQMSGGVLKFSVYFQNPDTQEEGITTFDLAVKQKYVLTSTNAIKGYNNYFGYPVPELEISNVYSDITDYGLINDYYKLMPYGIKFEVGSVVKQEGGDDYFIFIHVREGVKKIVVEGYCNGFNVSLGNEYIESLVTTHLTIPIKNNGGALCYDKLGSMIDFDFEPSIEQAYKKGLYVLNNPDVVTLDTDLFSMLYKEQGTSNIPAMLGRFRRNQGQIRNNASSLSFRQNQESGVPNITGGCNGGIAGRSSAGGSGALRNATTSTNNNGDGNGWNNLSISINAALVNAHYLNNHDEVTPDNFAVRYCYFAF